MQGDLLFLESHTWDFLLLEIHPWVANFQHSISAMEEFLSTKKDIFFLYSYLFNFSLYHLEHWCLSLMKKKNHTGDSSTTLYSLGGNTTFQHMIRISHNQVSSLLRGIHMTMISHIQGSWLLAGIHLPSHGKHLAHPNLITTCGDPLVHTWQGSCTSKAHHYLGRSTCQHMTRISHIHVSLNFKWWNTCVLVKSHYTYWPDRWLFPPLILWVRCILRPALVAHT